MVHRPRPNYHAESPVITCHESGKWITLHDMQRGDSTGTNNIWERSGGRQPVGLFVIDGSSSHGDICICVCVCVCVCVRVCVRENKPCNYLETTAC